MYKRRARVLFICAERPPIARLAAALSAELAGQWLEARAGDAQSAQPQAWADLIVTLGSASAAQDRLPAGAVHRHWRLPQALLAGEQTHEALRGELGRRLTAMAGGLRMMARSGR